MRDVVMLSALLLCVPLTATTQTAGRIKVERATQLPRHAYPVSTPNGVYRDRAELDALLADAKQRINDLPKR